MDPQIRQLLEVTRECLENAGETQYGGKRIGCYIGTFGEDWLLMQTKDSLQGGSGHNVGHMDLLLANRVSYEFGLSGPSMVIKTGCSASLVALHEACRVLQAGDAAAAVVGGSSLILTPKGYEILTSRVSSRLKDLASRLMPRRMGMGELRGLMLCFSRDLMMRFGMGTLLGL